MHRITCSICCHYLLLGSLDKMSKFCSIFSFLSIPWKICANLEQWTNILCWYLTTTLFSIDFLVRVVVKSGHLTMIWWESHQPSHEHTQFWYCSGTITYTNIASDGDSISIYNTGVANPSTQHTQDNATMSQCFETFQSMQSNLNIIIQQLQ